MCNEIMVRMGELASTNDSESVLTALGLGSCIGICAYDPITRVGGMAHVVLPESMGKAQELPAKSADIALPNLIESMVKAGAQRSRIRLAIAGGAQLFAFMGASNHMDIGSRNGEAVGNAIKIEKLRVVASDLGGNTGRTLKLYTDTGTVSVRRAGEPEKTLVKLA